MTLTNTLQRCALACGAFALGFMASGQVTIGFDAAQRGPEIGPLHYGIFYEEINHAGDGGLYAELIQNRSFEDNTGAPDCWDAVGKAQLRLVRRDLLNDAQFQALQVTLSGSGDGVSNTGFWGISAVEGRTYTLTFWLRSADGYKGTLTAGLYDGDTDLGSTPVAVVAGKDWQKVTATFTATATAPKAKFRLTGSAPGVITLDVVSLFPPTFKNRENGCREDLAQMLADMKPRFVRFPGGCYVEGSGDLTSTNRFEWKKTVGPIEERPGHHNVNWGYRVTDGLGYHELLQLTEDLGATPLFVANIGIGHGWMVPYNQIDEFIQEALDAIEYANGGTDTYWGALRAKNGHPEPFGLRLVEIGNENGQDPAEDLSNHYPERYKQFYDVLKARYPEITLIGNVEAWGTDTPGWHSTFPCEVVDEHYYRTPEWFRTQYSRYAMYDRSNPKVYVGEYAVTENFGTYGNLKAALGEAVYMMGMENNSDIVVMNSYAPIFTHEESYGWKPDMIRYNSAVSYGTPSYHVQQMMPNYLGKVNVAFTEDGNFGAAGKNRIGLSTWNTSAAFDNVTVRDAAGNTLFSDDFSGDMSAWEGGSAGSWSVSAGALYQSNTSMQGDILFCTQTVPDSYVIELDATKNGGSEGFLIAFNYKDSNNWTWWNLGGWWNASHGIETCVNGSKSTIVRTNGSLVNGHKYHIKIEVEGEHVRCYLDGELVHDVVMPVERRVYVSSSIDDATKTMYIKMVNHGAEAQEVKMNIANATVAGVEAVILTSSAETDENTTDNPMAIAPQAATVDSYDAGSISYTAQPYSLTIFTVKLSDINYTAPSARPATDAQTAAATAELESTMCRVRSLHNSMTLPVALPSGATVAWELLAGADSRLALEASFFSAYLAVTPHSEANTTEAGTLRASVTFADGAVATIDYPITLAAADGMHGYLMTYRNTKNGDTNYALSTIAGQGNQFEALGAEADVLADVDASGRTFIGRGKAADEYIATVAPNYGGKLAVLRSPDMLHWTATGAIVDGTVSSPRFIATPEGYTVFFGMQASGDNYSKIYCASADNTLATLGTPEVLYDNGATAGDPDITLNPYDGLYHMWIKATESGKTVLKHLTAPKLAAGEWTVVGTYAPEGSSSVEMPAMVRRLDDDDYNIYYMRAGSALRMANLDHLGTNAHDSFNTAGNGSFGAASLMYLNEAEYTMLEAWSEVKELMAKADAALAENSSAAIEAARAAAVEAFGFTDVATLSTELPKAAAMLRDALAGALAENLPTDAFTDITYLLENPAFAGNKGDGWQGTPFTAVNSGIAEQWNKTFDNYQVLAMMPAGTYRLTASAFYRFGVGRASYDAHLDGSEDLLAVIYAGDAETPVMSLYDESAPYTYSPFNYPDNIWSADAAFNTDGNYADNSVEYEHPATGDIRLGIRKLTGINQDWTAFDNFKLYFKPSSRSGIEDLAVDNDALLPVNVYTLTGICVRRGVERANATAGLAPGIYIVGNSKVLVK